jgi:hypothetical protein
MKGRIIAKKIEEEFKIPIKEIGGKRKFTHPDDKILAMVTPEIAAKIVKLYVLPMFNKAGN